MFNGIDISKLQHDRELVNNDNTVITKYIDKGNNDRPIVIKRAHRHQRYSENEVKILDKIASPEIAVHPNIIGYYGHRVINGVPRIFLECMSCSLEVLLRKNTLLNDQNEDRTGKVQARRHKIAISVAFALQYLHLSLFVHCDIKPANILLNITDDITDVKLCDFGLTVDLADHSTRINWDKGTDLWLAPEIAGHRLKLLRNEPSVLNPSQPDKMDIWSYGQTILQCLLDARETRGKPYSYISRKSSITVLYERIQNGSHDPIPPDQPLTKLVTWCLNLRPTRRPTAGQIIDELMAVSNQMIDHAVENSMVQVETTTQDGIKCEANKI